MNKRNRARHEAERLLRQLHGQGDLSDVMPLNLHAVCDHLGLVVVYRNDIDYGGQKLAGMLFSAEGYTIAWVEKKLRPRDRRAMLAHLIGHRMLHTPGETWCEKFQHDLDIERHQLMQEAEANAFAAQLMMPETSLRRALLATFDCGVVDTSFPEVSDWMSGMAKTYGVSERALYEQMRIHNLLVESFTGALIS